MAERPVRPEAPRAGREPADPLPQPRGAAPRGHARGDDRARARDARADHAPPSATGRTGAWPCATSSGSRAPASAARWPPRATSSPTSRCSSSPATRCTASTSTRTSPPSRGERLDAMALRLPGAPCDGARRAGRRRLPPQRARRLDAARRPRMSADPSPACASTAARSGCRTIDGCLPCHGDQDGLLEGNRRMLEELRGDVDPGAHPTCEFQGPVQIHPTRAARPHAHPRARHHRSRRAALARLRRPLHVDRRGRRPSRARRSSTRSCSTAPSCCHVGTRLESSVIGRGARDHAQLRVPSAMRLSVGDGAEVRLS